jgi:class 3 adenylate cyclase/tetratricopeptide (TPR) repeat protein
VFCGACRAPATPAQRFCANCGASLQEAPAPPRERRLVAILFCDLVGFTTFSENRDHEDVRDVLEHYFTAARRSVATYGGHVEKFIGDAVMALWGAPVAREDDAERAVRAGLDITAAVRAVAQRLAIPELEVRVGVLTGEAAVDIGPIEEGMVIGDAVNTAARIQSLAPPGAVLVDDTTRRMCAETIEFREAGDHPVKGKADRVRTWQALRVRGAGTDFARAGVVQPPFVGRTAELHAVHQALEEVVASPAGVRLVTVVGEAGLGKSRLAWEVETASRRAAAPPRWHRGRAVSFGEGTGFHALAEMVRAAAGLALGDATVRQRAGVEQLLARALTDPAERDRVRPTLHRLLDLDDAAVSLERGELFSAWRLLLERMAQHAPLVLVFDELQFADQALLDFIAHLREWATEARILILAQSRPDERVQALAVLGRSVTLGPLTGDEMEQLVAGTVREAPAELCEAIRADGGGIPLYAVESLRSLADQGVLATDNGRFVVRGELREASVPPTIRALIASRLDALDQTERRLLVAGAVLGEHFTASAAATIVDVGPGEARVVCERLAAKAILAATGGDRYEFLQGMVRRVALANLSRRDRKRLHLAAAARLREAAEPEAAALAGHLLAALDAGPTDPDVAQLREQARGALVAAAERAVAVTSIDEALRFFDRAIELAPDADARVALQERSGAAAARAGQPAQAAARWGAAAEAHAAAGRDRQRLAASAHRLRALRYTRRAAELLPELRALDDELAGTDDGTAALAAAVLAFTLYQCGDNAASLAAAERAAAIAERCDARGELLQALGAQAAALGELGRQEEALAVYDRSLRLAPDHDPARLPDITGNRAVTLGSIGRFAESAAGAREAIALARRRGIRFVERWGHLVLGRALCSLGDWDEATAAIDAVRADVPPFHVGMAYAPLVVIALGRGDLTAARDLVAEHDARGGEDTSEFAGDFRCLRAGALAVLASDGPALARVLPGAQAADFAEWSGWVPAVVSLLVTRAPAGAAGDAWLAAAAAALSDPADPARSTAPVRAQALRLAAWQARRAGDAAAARTAWAQAGELAASCGMAHETAAIDAERTRADAAQSPV